MEVRSVTNPGANQNSPNPGANQAPSTAPTQSPGGGVNHVSKSSSSRIKRRKRPGKVKTTLPIVKSNEKKNEERVSRQK